MAQVIADVFTEKRRARIAQRQVRLKAGSIFVGTPETVLYRRLDRLTQGLGLFALGAVGFLLVEQFGRGRWW